MKTAYLVDFSIRTRIIVDIPEGMEPKDATLIENPVGSKILNKAIEKISQQPKLYLEDNLENIFVDEECPYPCGKEEEMDKSADGWFTQADFRTMEEIFNLHHEDFDEAEGYQEFVDTCEKRWNKLDPAAKDFYHKKYA